MYSWPMYSWNGSSDMVSPRTLSRLGTRAGLVAALLVAGAVSGCGVRGGLDAPPEAKAAGTATSPDAADAGANSAVKPKPHRPFVLDGLLR
jgi:predicted small lipoprotein YifL